MAARDNEMYNESVQSISLYNAKLAHLRGLNEGLRVLSALIAKEEERWQEDVLRALEAEIVQALAFVYPLDGYKVSLQARLLRGKIHIETTTNSYFTPELAGDIDGMQGRLFQQVVSFSALIGIMKILGINTVYIDEAFSGVAPSNIPKINALLSEYKRRGFNLVVIAQTTSMASGLDANILWLQRSIDNKTSISSGGML